MFIHSGSNIEIQREPAWVLLLGTAYISELCLDVRCVMSDTLVNDTLNMSA